LSANNFTHIAFSDDSNHSSGQYKSLCLVTILNSHYLAIINELQNIFTDSNILNEFKWIKLKTAKYRLAAEKIINYIFLHQNKLRIDTIIWNMGDRRHKNVVGINNEENLVRMYYHLFSCVTSKRWPVENIIWKWLPDIQSSVDWCLLQDCIINKKHLHINDLFTPNKTFENINVINITPSESHNYLFVQIADLFAGLAAYSHGEFSNYKDWENSNSSQVDLFNNTSAHRFSGSQKERFHIISFLNNLCKKHKLSVALDSTNGFINHNPKSFINFWLYKPQYEMDKAPKRQ
jgi:hypothetical protein